LLDRALAAILRGRTANLKSVSAAVNGSRWFVGVNLTELTHCSLADGRFDVPDTTVRMGNATEVDATGAWIVVEVLDGVDPLPLLH